MNIILFEGIASSGKTTIEQMLLKQLPSIEIISEDITLIPLFENHDVEVAKEHLQSILQTTKEQTCDILILDRFHLTHAFRTQSSVEPFAAIETELIKLGNPLLVLLTIDPAHIRERIEETIHHRAGGWTKAKQGTLDERVCYYEDQQEELIAQFQQSSLPKIRIDTTEKNWDAIVQQISTLIKHS